MAPYAVRAGLRGSLRGVDVRAERLEGDPPLLVARGARDLRAVQTAADLDLDPLGAGAHRVLHGALHGAAEGDALHQLVRDAVGDELGIHLGTLHLLDVDRRPGHPGGAAPLLTPPGGPA